MVNDPVTPCQLWEVIYEEVMDQLHEISACKACDIDCITAHLIKACGFVIEAPLRHVQVLKISVLIPDFTLLT